MAHFVAGLKASRDRIRWNLNPITPAARKTLAFFGLQTSIRSSQPDLLVAGTDELDMNGNLIKGNHSDFLEEIQALRQGIPFWIAASAERRFENLGTSVGVPVQFTADVDLESLSRRFPRAIVKARELEGLALTRRGNRIVDIRFATIPDPAELLLDLQKEPGYLECGLVLGTPSKIILGGLDGQ